MGKVTHGQNWGPKRNIDQPHKGLDQNWGSYRADSGRQTSGPLHKDRFVVGGSDLRRTHKTENPQLPSSCLQVWLPISPNKKGPGLSPDSVPNPNGTGTSQAILRNLTWIGHLPGLRFHRMMCPRIQKIKKRLVPGMVLSWYPSADWWKGVPLILAFHHCLQLLSPSHSLGERVMDEENGATDEE